MILSSDADFTPVALRLRAHDRTTSILANQQTAAAFRSCCDVVIDMEDFEPVVGDGTERVPMASGPSPEPKDPVRASVDADGDFDAIRADIKTAIDEELAAASEPVVIGSLAMRIQQRWPIVRDSDWLGTGGFKNFLFLPSVELAHGDLGRAFRMTRNCTSSPGRLGLVAVRDSDRKSCNRCTAPGARESAGWLAQTHAEASFHSP